MEKASARRIREQLSRVRSSASPSRLFLLALVVTPLMIMEALFIPVLGWMVILIAWGSTFVFLSFERSKRLVVAWLLGTCGGCLLFTNVVPLLLKTSAGIPLYVMVFIATLSILAYSIALGFGVVRRIKQIESSLEA